METTTNTNNQPKQINHDQISVGTIVRHNGQHNYKVIRIDPTRRGNSYRLLDLEHLTPSDAAYRVITVKMNRPCWAIVAN